MAVANVMARSSWAAGGLKARLKAAPRSPPTRAELVNGAVPDDVASVGSALLHLHLAGEGKYRAILFPDNPFPQRVG